MVLVANYLICRLSPFFDRAVLISHFLSRFPDRDAPVLSEQNWDFGQSGAARRND